MQHGAEPGQRNWIQMADPIGRQPFNLIQVGGVPFSVASMASAVQWILNVSAAQNTRRPAVRLANSYCVALAASEPEYRKVLTGAFGGITLPDGAPVAFVMKLLARRSERPSRVRGPSLFRAVLSASQGTGIRHFFLGSSSETLDALIAEVSARYPLASIAGAYSPPFKNIDEAYLNELVRRAAQWETDIVWVGMGTPKQDFVAIELANRANLTAIGVGAGFDFIAGTVREAPHWMQIAGIEWLYRLYSEPQRLWRRYIFGNLRFIMEVIRHAVNNSRHAVNDRRLSETKAPSTDV